MAQTNTPRTAYPMRLVSRETGLSADTLRVWERRYRAVTPARSDGNTRLYSEADIQRLKKLAEATRRGHAISQIATLSTDALDALLAEPAATAFESDAPLNINDYDRMARQYLDHIDRFEARAANRLLSRLVLALSPDESVHKLIRPLLVEIGKRWESGRFSVAQEHLASQQIRRQLEIMLQYAMPDRGAPRVVVATPNGFLHDLGALIAAFLAARRGFEPIFLGASVPAADLVAAVKKHRAEWVILSMIQADSQPSPAKTQKELARIAAHSETWVGVSDAADRSHLPAGLRVFTDFESFEIALADRLT